VAGSGKRRVEPGASPSERNKVPSSAKRTPSRKKQHADQADAAPALSSGSAGGDRAALARLAQTQRLETVGRLTGGVAHDFNNILTVVIGNSELLLESESLSPADRRLIEITLAAARSGADLVRMLLAYSRQQPLSPVEFDPNALIEEMLDLLVRSLGTQVRIETDLAPDLWGVCADRAQLGSVLLNLAVNARDAMKEGGILNIATGNWRLDKKQASIQRLPHGDYVSIAVADSGAGMPPEVLERVFEPFFTTKAEGRGNGLGLAMVQGFVRQSGGQVRILSTPGAGTTVQLLLPRAGVQLDLPNIGPDDALRLAREGETVLVVEDNDRVRHYVGEQLRRFGYTVIESGDAKSALRALRQEQRVDLLFSDLDMPGTNGVKLAEQARRLHPRLRVLFTSAHADIDLAPEQRFRHGYRLLPKPYRRQELARMLRTTLDELL
jgi:signal transduction histidine kinase/CheY-like chemotaxis protein